MGETGNIDGVEYTKRDRAGILTLIGTDPVKLTTTCTSGITNMTLLFLDKVNFNEDISHWDVSAVTNMSWMFNWSSAFNQDIGNWDVSSVSDMSHMFNNASSFNQNLQLWCVKKIAYKPDDFNTNSGLSEGNLPEWGNCHKPFYLSENGLTIICETATEGESGDIGGITYYKRSVDNITIENAATTCTSGVTDMSELFKDETNFNEDITHWDVSSVTSMNDMFSNAKSFNQKIGRWDVSSVISMNGMFYESSAFNQNLQQWCVENITSKPNNFSANSSLLQGQHPIWGTCPSRFYVAENDVTIICSDARVGDSNEIDGITYTKRRNNQITVENAATTCTSGIIDMKLLFFLQRDFNENIKIEEPLHEEKGWCNNFKGFIQYG